MDSLEFGVVQICAFYCVRLGFPPFLPEFPATFFSFPLKSVYVGDLSFSCSILILLNTSSRLPKRLNSFWAVDTYSYAS